MGERINEWRQVGAIHLWRYQPEKGGLKGWHLSASDEGLVSTIALVELLCAAPYPSKRTLHLARPSDRTINGPFSPVTGRKVISPTSLQLSVDADDPEGLWQLDEEGDRVRLRLGRQSATKLLDGLRLLKQQGFGDFTIGPTRGEPLQNIWLW